MENVPEDALEGETEEVEEIVEIIEEIEEIEEFVEEESESTNVEKGHEISDSQVDDDSQEDSENEHGEMFKVSNNLQNRRSYGRKKPVVTYDPDDWEDEENEHYQGGGLRPSKGQMAKNSSIISSMNKTHSMNGKRSREDDRPSSNRTSTEPLYKVVKTRTMDYAGARNNSNSLEEDDEEDEEEEEEEEEEQEGEREHEQELEQEREQEQEEEEEEEDDEEEEEESQHEIVKSAENNLLYTVLGSKKSSSGTGKTKKDNSASQAQESARYMKMERVDDGTIPIEGTIYYEGDNMETVYVAQSTNEENEQYHYEDQQNEQGEQEWEEAHEDANENQAQQEAEEEPVQQDQIFLHEDEDGQLYFKDDSGTLQPVYLTADGNYAIAENSSDEQEVQENTNNRQAALTSSTTTDTDKGFDDDNFIVPELDGAASGSNTNDPENEDNTVTISLIISEDENGQKRTQVIIPTTDNLKCELCAKSFKTSFQLLRHNRLKHAREEDITTRNFPCDLCPKRYSDQNTLARHRKSHLGDRPFGCLECGKSFPTSTALRRHLTQHNPQSRPLPCIYCGRRFSEKSALTQHEQSHLAGDQRTHMCDICHKSFLQAADLNLHKKNHDPNKKFDCEVCGREFNRLNNLQRHMMVHKQKQGGNQEILACDVCGITYKFMSSLTRHMVTSHMNPEKLRQQAEEQRKKRENNYRRYLENRKMYETQHTGADYIGGGGKRSGGYRSNNDNDEDTA